MLNTAYKILSAIADGECRKICRQTIRRLQEMDAANISDLENAWNEVCVQVQGQESVFWDTYVDSAVAATIDVVRRVDGELRKAIWLQTENGQQYQPEGAEEVPDYEDDIAEYIWREYLLRAASDWTNARIRQHLE
jgi:hypothetical protein